MGTPRGERQGEITGPFAPRLWRCLRRFACFGPQHLLLSEHFLRMSQARRWFWHSQGGTPGCNHGPVRAQIVGMSQAVCLFACPTSSPFGAVFEDVSGEALVSGLPMGGARGCLTGPFAPRLWGCIRRFACWRAQHLLLSEQISQARRWFQHLGLPTCRKICS